MNNPNDMKVDSYRALTYHRGDSTGRRRVDGWIWLQCTGDATETAFTFADAVPAGSLVDNLAVINLDTAMTAATTVKIGHADNDDEFMAATSFTSTMNAATAKAPTVIPYFAAAAKTPLVTFSAALDDGADVLIGVHIVPLPV